MSIDATHGRRNGAEPAQAAAQSARIEGERQRRRRREDIGPNHQRRLAVDTRNFDPAYTYRFINDEPGRVHALTKQDDWDIVTSAEIGERDAKEKGVGTGVEFVVDRSTGKRAVLVRKPLDYYKADKAKEQARIAQVVADIKRGEHKSAEALNGPTAYVPEGGIQIRDGR